MARLPPDDVVQLGFGTFALGILIWTTGVSPNGSQRVAPISTAGLEKRRTVCRATLQSQSRLAASYRVCVELTMEYAWIRDISRLCAGQYRPLQLSKSLRSCHPKGYRWPVPGRSGS